MISSLGLRHLPRRPLSQGLAISPSSLCSVLDGCKDQRSLCPHPTGPRSCLATCVGHLVPGADSIADSVPSSLPGHLRCLHLVSLVPKACFLPPSESRPSQTAHEDQSRAICSAGNPSAHHAAPPRSGPHCQAPLLAAFTLSLWLLTIHGQTPSSLSGGKISK